MGIEGFENSPIWQAAILLAAEVYMLANTLPQNEQFAFSSQIRRAIVSVSSNIAEGFGRSSVKEKLQFYSIAYGSLLETKSLLLLGEKLGFFEISTVEKLTATITSLQKQINATKAALKVKQL